MICPDCGAALSGLPLASDGNSRNSFRCSRCGGWWVEPELVNKSSYVSLLRFPRLGIDSRWITSKGGKCPLDNSELVVYRGEAMPDEVTAKRCASCGWWWFPTDDFYRYKEAAEAKLNYARLWGSRANVTGLALPLAIVAILVVGLGVGVYVVRTRQQAAVEANAGVADFKIIDEGLGRIKITFTSNLFVEYLAYKEVNETDYRVVQVEKNGTEYQVELAGLKPSLQYGVKILGKEYSFETYAY